MILGYLIALAVAFWVGQDAQKRGMNPIGWGIFVFLIMIIGLPVYLATRKPIGSKKGEGHDDLLDDDLR